MTKMAVRIIIYRTFSLIKTSFLCCILSIPRVWNVHFILFTSQGRVFVTFCPQTITMMQDGGQDGRLNHNIRELIQKSHLNIYLLSFSMQCKERDAKQSTYFEPCHGNIGVRLRET